MMAINAGSYRADIGQARLRQPHAIGDMARLADVEVEREYGLRAALLGGWFYAGFGKEAPIAAPARSLARWGRRRERYCCFIPLPSNAEHISSAGNFISILDKVSH